MKDTIMEIIGKIPDDWSLRRVKYISDSFAKGNGITKEDIKEDGDIQCVRYGEIYTRYDGCFEKTSSRTNVSLVDSAKYLKKGDILFACTGELVEEIGKNIVYMGDEPCLAGGDILVMTHHQNPVFMNYALNSICSQIQKSCGKAKLKVVHISESEIGNILIALPPLDKQIAISSFLDKKCQYINNIIDKTRASIDEYKKLRQAVITQAVTKGIRGNRQMKNSGIDWIGDVPANWSIVRIKNIFTLRDERNFLPLQEVNLISLYTDQGVVQHSDLEKTTGNKATNADGYKLVYENDIVVNIILCWMGAIGRSAYNGVTSPAYDIYVPSPDIESEFYHHFFRTSGFSGECFKRGRGIMLMRWRTYSDQFRDIRVPCPPLEEQREILAYLNRKCFEIDNLLKRKTIFLNEMESYKKSLIHEYVTGKKEVAS